jgi:nitroimidazol reductase NimA-like FMN-containing flavoprotein (pyridoxamine 5'-phosphate oxidase superfamily)
MGFRDLTPEETDTVLQKERVIRLSLSADGETFVVPVFYVWKAGALCGLTTPGRKTRLAAANPRCAFQVDSTGPWEWASVSGEGEIALIDDPAEQMAFIPQMGERLADAPAWAQELLQQRFATLGRIGWRLRPTAMSGRAHGPD